MKNNKGITLIGLIITVIILVIISAVTISISTNIAGLAEFETIETNLLLIQSKTKVMADKKAIGEITEEDLLGTKQTSGTYEGWYLLSQANLDEMGLKEAKAEDEYYVNYENDDIAYGTGIEYKGVKYYKLSEIKKD